MLMGTSHVRQPAHAMSREDTSNTGMRRSGFAAAFMAPRIASQTTRVKCPRPGCMRRVSRRSQGCDGIAAYFAASSAPRMMLNNRLRTANRPITIVTASGGPALRRGCRLFSLNLLGLTLGQRVEHALVEALLGVVGRLAARQ